MSKIDDLIKELCPNGVTFKSIDSVADLYYGKGNNIPKDGGEYPVYGCYGIVSSTSTFNNEDTPIVGHIGSAGKVSWGAGKHYVTYNGISGYINKDSVCYGVLCWCLPCSMLESTAKMVRV